MYCRGTTGYHILKYHDPADAVLEILDDWEHEVLWSDFNLYPMEL